MKMKQLRYIILAISLLLCVPALSQTDRREVRRGNREFRRADYRSADISYRKALLKDSVSFAANYNLASVQYRQGNVEEASAQMRKIAQAAPLSPDAPDYYFNVGDYALAAKDWQGAIEAFQQVLLRHPEDMEAKENLAYAKKMKQDEDQDQDKDQDKDQDQNQDENQDQNQDENQDQNQDQDQNQERDGGGQEPKISPQQAQQMIQAIQAREKETQEKVKKAEAEAVKTRRKEKNW